VDRICILLGYFAVYSGNSLLKFCDNIVAPSSRVKKSKKKVSIPPKREMGNWRETIPQRCHALTPASSRKGADI